jgi:hypothetical protein
MGYTHYHELKRITKKDLEGYKEALPVVRHILERYSEILRLDCDEPDKTPVANEEKIWFNGLGENGYETFVFRINQNFSGFTKTARKPYDQAVCEVLLVLKAFLPNFSVGSDGFSGHLAECEVRPTLDGTWMEAIDSVEQYGLYYTVEITERREPYCDMGLVLVKTEKWAR